MNVTLHTNHGDIGVALFPEAAPKTVDNFVGLARGTKDYKDDAGRTSPTPVLRRAHLPPHHPRLHDPGRLPRSGRASADPGYTFDDEISPDKDFTKPYMLAMANAGKRGGKGTNGSQFFITVGPTTWLQGKHTIFGEVADQASRDVVDAIANVRTGANDRPVEPVVIERVTVTD